MIYVMIILESWAHVLQINIVMCPRQEWLLYVKVVILPFPYLFQLIGLLKVKSVIFTLPLFALVKSGY